MGWDWLGTASTAVVGLAGIYGTSRATTRQIEGERQRARDERNETRLEAAYLELLAKVSQAVDWAYGIATRWHSTPENLAFDRPDIYVKTLSSQGLLSVHWSPRISQLVEQMRGYINTATNAWVRSQIGDASRTQGVDDDDYDPGLLNAFAAAKKGIEEMDRQIRQQVADELAGRSDGEAR
jgi:hypothetical protein